MIKNVGRVCKYLSAMLLILLVCAGLGAVALVVALKVPVNSEKKAETMQQIESEDFYPDILQGVHEGESYFHSAQIGVLDNGTDYLMLQTALFEYTTSARYQAMDMYSDYMGSYSYYWHGYVAILRILSMVFNYAQIRTLNGILQILLIIVTFLVIWRKKALKYSFLLLSTYFLLMPLALRYSLQYSSVFYLSFLGTLVVVLFAKKLLRKELYVFLFLMLGVATSYFDLLTYPLLTWGLPIIFLLLCMEESGIMRNLRTVVLSGLSWILGYGGFWYLKWFLATDVVGRNVVQEAFNEILFRTGTQEGATWNTRISTMVVNKDHFYNWFYGGIILAGLLVFICCFLFKRGNGNDRIPSFFLISVAPVCWYCVLTNHTEIHHFFTYRIYVIAITGMFAIFLEFAKGDWNLKAKEGLMRLSIVAGALLVAFLLSGLTAGDEWKSNGSCTVSERVMLTEGDVFTTEFHPESKIICQFGILISQCSPQGGMLIELYEDGSRIAGCDIVFGEGVSGRYNEFDTDWYLEDKDYSLAVSVWGEEAEAEIVLVDGNGTFSEYRNSRINDMSLDGQIVTSLTYRSYDRPEGLRLGFEMMVWMLVLSSVICVGVSVFRKCREA